MDNERKAPWKRKNPRTAKEKVTLTAKFKTRAKLRAAAAGRNYPNLVDNMWAAGEQRKEKSSRKKT